MSAAERHVTDDAILVVDRLSKRFDELLAVDAVSLAIRRGSITGLIGPNGAGKSTLFDCIVGEQRPDSGRIDFDGTAVQGETPERLFRRGLARTFQLAQPFPEMSVIDNLMLAAPEQLGERAWAPWLRPAAIRRQEATLLQRAHELLVFTTLEPVAQLAAGQLSGGQQKLLELARVLMGGPRLILLDEPGAGVNPALCEVLIDRIHALNQAGMTFLMIEHNMDLVMHHCDPIIAMADGRVIFEGSASAAMASDALLDSYLGEPRRDVQ